MEKFKINKIKKINNNSPIVLKPDVGSGQRNLFKITKNSKSEIIKKSFFFQKIPQKINLLLLKNLLKVRKLMLFVL